MRGMNICTRTARSSGGNLCTRCAHRPRSRPVTSRLRSHTTSSRPVPGAGFELVQTVRSVETDEFQVDAVFNKMIDGYDAAYIRLSTC